MIFRTLKALAVRELKRFAWWAAAYPAADYAYEYALAIEKESGYFSKRGWPVPTYGECAQMVMDQLEIEGKL